MIKKLMTKRLCYIAFMAFTLFLMVKAVQPFAYHSDRTPRMNNIPPRIMRLFQKTHPVCFGRFMMEVPEQANVVWGEAHLPYIVNVYPGAGTGVRAQIRDTVAEITEWEHTTEPSMLLGIFDSVNIDSKIVVGYTSGSSTSFAKFYSYIRLGEHAFLNGGEELGMFGPDLSQGADKKYAYLLVEEFRDFAHRLRLRADNEVPTDPGVCIEKGFVSVGLDYKELELISVGFQFPEFPDVSFWITTHSMNKPSEDESLEAALKRGREESSAIGLGKLYELIRTLRKGDRVIGSWSGAESLAKVPGKTFGSSEYEFLFMTPGAASDYTRPSVSVGLNTGMKAVSKEFRLTDAEAIAFWDKLTSSIRVRPTVDPAASGQALEK